LRIFNVLLRILDSVIKVLKILNIQNAKIKAEKNSYDFSSPGSKISKYLNKFFSNFQHLLRVQNNYKSAEDYP